MNSTPGGYDCVVTTNNPCCAATINSAVGSLTVSPICACNYADISDQSGNGGGPDGQTTVSDLTFFLSEFFANSLTADISGQAGNGPPSDPPDGQVTVSDLVFFLAQFFSPCTNP